MEDKNKKIELIKKAIIEVCPNALPTEEFESKIGCTHKGVECDCDCIIARIIELMINAGYRKVSEVHEPKWEEVNEQRVVVEQYWRVKCPCCGDTLCGCSLKDGLEEEIPNYCPNCGIRLKEIDNE